MRLDEREIHAIRTCAERHFGPGCTVRLFGSRVDDARRGGDIDLHVEADSAGRASLEAEIAFRLDLAAAIGEQRVDVLLRAPGYRVRPIDVIALRTGCLLRAHDALLSYADTKVFGGALGLDPVLDLPGDEAIGSPGPAPGGDPGHR